MYRLFVLGESSLQDAAGRLVQSVTSQPRRYALLVYLALAKPGRTVRRDTLLSLFWPELPQDAARHALRQALLHLRQSVGRDAVTGNRQEEIGIDASRLWCDAVDFNAAIERDAFEDAVRLYRGELLPGFFLDHGSADFEHWLETERTVLRGLAADAAWQAAEAAAAARNAAAAGAYARTCAGLARGDETLLRRSLALLGQLGDQAGAVVLYDDFARWLRQHYETEPSSETRALVESLRRPTAHADAEVESIRLAASSAAVRERVTAGAAAGSDDASAVTAAPASPPPRSRPKQQGVLALLGLSALVMVVFTSLWGVGENGTPDAGTVPWLLVEQVQDYTDAGDRQRLAGALTAEVAGRIAEAGHIEIVTASPDHEPVVVTPPHRPVFVLRAGIRSSGDSIRVNAVLLDGPSRAIIGRTALTREVTASVGAVDELAGLLAGFVRRELSRAALAERLRRGSRHAGALALVRAAIEDRKKADSLRAAGAIDAAAVWLQKTDSVLAHAQQISPDWHEPTLQRGEAELDRMWLELVTRGDTRAARAALARGLQHASQLLSRNRHDDAARELRAVMNYWLWHTLPADSTAGMDLLVSSIEADLRAVVNRAPTSGRAWNLLSAVLYTRGEFPEAYWAAERARRADTFAEHSADIAVRLFSSALESNDTPAARRWCDDIGRRFHRAPVHAYCQMMLIAAAGRDTRDGAALADRISREDVPAPWAARIAMLHAVVLGTAGRSDDAERIIGRASAAAHGDPEVLPIEAWARLRLGDSDRARTLLERYIAGNPYTRTGILRSPRFAPLQQSATE